ncbi:MAG: gamma-glutamyltranspeptidase / glutathione hydrolase [Thermoleophilaceae bacterium]|nr:gamma-glutamyltranspeptidase / glutathione hydrolase [Thermoleophilaceae bacterium]MEA2367531.1 gamma-glutamyltranspeptidase / glutathione hydrolase [Thermoleophilaceae bacterium]
MRGVVAAGHPLSAEAGAEVLREGGNAVDAAVATVLMSFVTESPLTGPGAGGFMLVHTAAGENQLLDFFVAAPGKGLDGVEPAALEPIDVHFSDEAVQVFNIGPSSCGVYGNPAGVAEALDRWGTMPLSALVEKPARAARDGVDLTPIAESFLDILAPILTATPEASAIYAPEGRLLRAGERLRMPELADLLERLGADGPRFLYEGEVASAASEWVRARGGLLTEQDLAEYAPIDREPACAHYRGREILTNPPPSSGGILIAYALDLLERLGGRHDVRTLVEVMDRANRERTDEFVQGLHAEGYLERFLHKEAIESAATELGSRLGSTTHASVLDAEGNCASVTCSNGSCSGVVVPGTGLHLNNMLGEEDLNPGGFHRHEPGRRIPSAMAPTVVLRDGRPEVALGSAGSNRIRSAVLQAILRIVAEGMPAQDAVAAPRVHYEGRVVEAEPGIDEDGLAALEREGWPVQRFSRRNLYFGGVQAAARDPETGELSGGGDPRRGGAALVIE